MSPVTNTRNCLVCSKVIHPTTGDINRGKGRFCSRRCSNFHRRRPLRDRFLERVGPPTESGCHLWLGSTKEGWHGQMGRGGRGGGGIIASRFAWELANGPIPDGMSVLHRCDVPACVNPEHLFLGTQTDNMADMTAKGRRAKGEQCRQAKLTEELVRDVRRRVAAGESQASVSRSLDISKASVCLIVAGQRWKHVV